MTRFDLLKQCDIELASKLIYALGRKFENPVELKEHLLGFVTEQELQRINDAARMEELRAIQSRQELNKNIVIDAQRIINALKKATFRVF